MLYIQSDVTALKPAHLFFELPDFQLLLALRYDSARRGLGVYDRHFVSHLRQTCNHKRKTPRLLDGCILSEIQRCGSEAEREGGGANVGSKEKSDMLHIRGGSGQHPNSTPSLARTVPRANLFPSHQNINTPRYSDVPL